MDIYGESPLKKVLQGIEQIRNERSASRVFVSTDAYRDIKKMKQKFKRKKSDIQLIKKTWRHHLHIEPIKFMNVELSLIDIDFIASIKQAQEDIFRMFGVPKEYIQYGDDNFSKPMCTLRREPVEDFNKRIGVRVDKLLKNKQ